MASIRASPSHHGEKLRWLEFLLKKNGSGPEIQTDASSKLGPHTQTKVTLTQLSGVIGKSIKFRLEWKWPVMGPK